MISLSTLFTEGVQDALTRHQVRWSVVQLGARSEYRFTHPAPQNGTTSMLAHDGGLDEFMHIFMANRGVLMTPFHNMALMCPTTTMQDVHTHTALFNEALETLVDK